VTAPPTDRPERGDEPPPGVTGDMLWRVAVRLARDHGKMWLDEADIEPRPRCCGCRQPWPCSGRRLAELGLITAGG
jgi:hypothetical protein